MDLPRLVIIRVLFRSFLLQASWNYERMQNLGVLFALSPALRKLYSGKVLKEAFLRHLTYFNTHPFMSAPVLAATLVQEEKRASGQDVVFSVEDFKGMIMAPYAAIGDALYWGGVRPFADYVAYADQLGLRVLPVDIGVPVPDGSAPDHDDSQGHAALLGTVP